MRMNIINSQEKVTKKIKDCIYAEMKPKGLLGDVNTFIPSYRMDEPMEEPVIWLFEHPTTVVENKSTSLNQKLYLETPFEFVCVVYDDDDIEQSEMAGKNLASRVAASIAKHAHDGDERIFSNVRFDTLYPVGEVQIQNKSKKAPATSVRVTVRYYIDWMNCCKKRKNIMKGDE